MDNTEICLLPGEVTVFYQFFIEMGPFNSNLSVVMSARMSRDICRVLIILTLLVREFPCVLLHH